MTELFVLSFSSLLDHVRTVYSVPKQTLATALVTIFDSHGYVTKIVYLHVYL